MNGLLDFLKTPAGQGLLAAGLGAASSYGRGRGLVGNLGTGGLMGMQAYTGAQQMQDRSAQEAQEREVRDLQLTKARRQDEYLKNIPAPTNPNQAMLVDAARAGVLPIADYLKLIQPKQLEFGKVDPKDYTPESLREATSTGDYTRLVPVRKMDVVGNRAVNLYETPAGKVFDQVDPNKPFAMVDGKMVANNPFQQYELGKASAGASRNTLINQTEREESKAIGKFFGESFADSQKAGLTAQGQVNRLNRLDQLLEGVDTGKFSPLGVEVAKAAQAAGLNIDPKLSNKEAAVALSSEIALQLRNPSGGAGMPGAMSDADRNFLAGMVPGIEKTPDGRKLIVETGKKLAQRDIEVARLARQYRQKKGNIDEGFYDELARYSEANPLFQKKESAAPGKSFESMPAANSSNKGRFLTDSKTGKRYQSNGMQWVEQK